MTVSWQVRGRGGEGGLFLLRSSDRVPLFGLPAARAGGSPGVAAAGDRLARLGEGHQRERVV